MPTTHNRQLSTTKLVRLPSREDLAEMAVAAGSREPAPLAPVHCTPQALPSASASNCPSLHHHERGSPMKNRKREICTSGSVRDEDGQPPHLLGRRNFLHLAAGAAAPRSTPRSYDKLNFDLIRDIAPVAGIMRAPLVMVVIPSFPAKTVPE